MTVNAGEEQFNAFAQKMAGSRVVTWRELTGVLSPNEVEALAQKHLNETQVLKVIDWLESSEADREKAKRMITLPPIDPNVKGVFMLDKNETPILLIWVIGDTEQTALKHLKARIGDELPTAILTELIDKIKTLSSMYGCPPLEDKRLVKFSR